MSAHSTEADRLRAARELFQRAQADGVSMAEAKRRVRADRWADADRRLAAKRCGTAEAFAPPNDPQPEQWWQR